MTEPTNESQYSTEVSDALEMLGKGYALRHVKWNSDRE
jgi:hypothetical protein